MTNDATTVDNTPARDATVSDADRRAATGSHVGYCPKCGQMVAAAVDDATTKKKRARNAKFVADLVREGCRVGYMTVAEVRAATWCDCRRAQKPADTQAEALL